MRQKSNSTPASSETLVRNIRRATRKHHAAEEKIRIVLDGLRGETSIAELIRREGVAESMYYSWSKEFLEAGKRRLAGDMARAATTDEVKQLRRPGLAFSAHPVSGKRDRFIIEASWGWGESVVQGTVEPDSVEVDRSDGRVLSCRVGDKRVASLFDPARGGVTEQPLPARFQRSQCLTPEMIRALWKAISEIERLACASFRSRVSNPSVNQQ